MSASLAYFLIGAGGVLTIVAAVLMVANWREGRRRRSAAQAAVLRAAHEEFVRSLSAARAVAEPTRSPDRAPRWWQRKSWGAAPSVSRPTPATWSTRPGGSVKASLEFDA